MRRGGCTDRSFLTSRLAALTTCEAVVCLSVIALDSVVACHTHNPHHTTSISHLLSHTPATLPILLPPPPFSTTSY